jgi:peptide/nickel transport system permease protein
MKVVEPKQPETEGLERHPTPSVMRRLWRRDKVAVCSGVGVLLIWGLSIAAPLLPLPDPNALDLSNRLAPIGAPSHPLGTDEFGRDLLSRLIWGGRVSVTVGIVAVALALTLGALIGLVAGFFRGILDTLLMRIIDVLMAFPYILLAIAVLAALGPGLMNTMLAIGIAGAPYYARLVRGSVLAVREKEFVEGVRALGAGAFRIIFRHILPNIAGPVIIAASLDVGWMIMAAAGMSFLGLGAQPPTAEWGIMLSNGIKYIRLAPHLSILPGLAIFLVVLAINLFGDGLREALDPKLARPVR